MSKHLCMMLKHHFNYNGCGRDFVLIKFEFKWRFQFQLISFFGSTFKLNFHLSSLCAAHNNLITSINVSSLLALQLPLVFSYNGESG